MTRDEVVGGEPGRSRRRRARRDVGHGRRSHRSRPGRVTAWPAPRVAAAVDAGRRLARRRAPSGGRRSRSGVVIASVATRRKSSNDITGISMLALRVTVGVPSSMLDGDDEVRDAVFADVADERVVEDVVLPGALAAVGLGVPDLGRAGLAADVVARHERPVAIEVDLVTTWFIIPQVGESSLRDHLAAAPATSRSWSPTAATTWGWTSMPPLTIAA